MQKSMPSSSRVHQFFAYIQMTGKELIHAGEVATEFLISKRQEQDLFHYLSKKGSIICLKPGVYLVPSRVPPGGRWQPDITYIIHKYMAVMEAKYYIGGLYAFHHHGLTEQIPNRLMVYNDKVSGLKQFGRLDSQFIKTSAKRIGGIKIIKLANGDNVYVASLTRAIVDAVTDYRRYSTLPKAYDWINIHKGTPGFLKNLMKMTINYGNVSARRRIGYTLLKLTDNAALVQPILKSLKPSKSWIPLNPYAEKKGKTNKTWRIVDNVDYQ